MTNLAHRPINLTILLILFTLIASPLAAQSKSIDAPDGLLTPEQLQADLKAWQNWTQNTHPDLTHSVSSDDYKKAVSTLSKKLNYPLNHRDAWLTFALLNPTFADAHVGLPLPTVESGENSQTGFPYPVYIHNNKIMLKGSVEFGLDMQGENLEILSINGEASSTILAGLMARMRGESDRLRAHIIELKFAGLLEMWQGPTESYTVEFVAHTGPTRTVTLSPNSKTAPQTEPFSLSFHESAAILTINSFDPQHTAEVQKFLPNAFKRITAAQSSTLIIDLRTNGGGAQEVSNPLMAYLTDQPHSPISAVKARITEENQNRIPNSEIGQVISLPFSLWSEPPADLANRFKGDIIVLVGPGTYSQAIAFAATVQDFDIGRIAGVETEGRVNQTAQVQQFTLPHTGFTVRAPLYIFTRASGDTSKRGLLPDIPLTGESDTHLNALLATLITEKE